MSVLAVVESLKYCFVLVLLVRFLLACCEVVAEQGRLASREFSLDVSLHGTYHSAGEIVHFRRK